MNGLASAEVKEVRCMRPGCSRKLTSLRSRDLGYGPVCARKIREAAKAEARNGFTEDQQAKAAQLIADKGIVLTARPGTYRVVALDGSETHLVTAHGCTCKCGLRGKRPCYHILAARVMDLTAAPLAIITQPQTRRAPLALAAA
jgi:hypothetical protein